MADGIDERNGVRKKEVLQQLVSEEEVQAIYRSNSNSSYFKSVLVWHYSANGVFSVKLGYNLAFQSQVSGYAQNPLNIIIFGSKQEIVECYLEAQGVE